MAAGSARSSARALGDRANGNRYAAGLDDGADGRAEGSLQGTEVEGGEDEGSEGEDEDDEECQRDEVYSTDLYRYQIEIGVSQYHPHCFIMSLSVRRNPHGLPSQLPDIQESEGNGIMDFAAGDFYRDKYDHLVHDADLSEKDVSANAPLPSPTSAPSPPGNEKPLVRSQRL